MWGWKKCNQAGTWSQRLNLRFALATSMREDVTFLPDLSGQSHPSFCWPLQHGFWNWTPLRQWS